MARKRDDSLLYQVGIYQGCDWNDAEIAELLGVSRQAIYMRKKAPENKAIVDLAESMTRSAMMRYVAERIKAAEEAAQVDVVRLKKRIRDKGYRVLEKKLDDGVREGVEVDALHLKAAEIGIEREEGKSLDRKAILSREEHVHILDVDGADLQGLLGEIAQITEMRKRALPAYVEEK